MAHTEIGFAVIKRGVDELAGMGHPDNEPKLLGRNIHVMLTPLPVNKRKPKLHVEEPPEDEAPPAEAAAPKSRTPKPTPPPAAAAGA